MTDTALSAAPPGFRVGAVFSRAFALLSRDFAKFFGLSLIAWAPFLVLSLTRGVPTQGLVAANMGKAVAGSAAAFILWIVLSLLCQAIILYGAFQQMRGQSFAIGESLKRGLTRFVPLIGLLLCLGISVGLATLLLVIPGVIVFLMWYIAVPACVIERQGPFGSLRRSAELTKGSRWKILGIIVILSIVSWLAQIIVQIVAAAVAGTTAAIVAAFLCSALIAAYRAILVAVIYHDLRVARDGIDIERIAAVFD